MSSPVQTQRALHLRGGEHAVLLFHGLSSSPQELQFLARGMNRAGYSVHVPVMAGYTYNGPDQALGRHDHWARAALAEFDKLQGQYSSVAVGGLCIGAVLALRVAALRAPQVSAVLALSTTLHYDGWATPWTRRLLPLAAWVPWAQRIGVREAEPFGVKDERMRAWIGGQMREAGNSDAGAAILRVGDLLQARRLIRQVRHRLGDISSPVLAIHAKEDDAASPRSAWEVANRVASGKIRVVMLSDSYHMISIDREKHQVLREMCQFLQDTVDAHAKEQARPSLGKLFSLDALTTLRKIP